MGNGWFDVDRKGLAKLLDRKGKEFVVYELVQNAWDENTRKVAVTFDPVEGRSLSELWVEDDNPEGFKDLTHAYTMFAESDKKDDPTKRGRFNLGEKLVLACCERAEIITTKGCIVFEGDQRTQVRTKREKGSIFRGFVKMTRTEHESVVNAVRRLIPPAHIETTFNGVPLPTRKPVRSFEVALPTERADAEGYLRPTVRKTTVNIYEPLPDNGSWIYEMGIPVCETFDRWDVEVMQKVPLNADRDNVTPGYLKAIRTEVLNYMATSLRGDETNAAWVQAAMNSEDADPVAVAQVLTEKFGEKFVVSSPEDPEADANAVANGYVVLPANAISKQQRKHLEQTGLGYHRSIEFFPTDPGKFVPGFEIVEDTWTPGMQQICNFARDLAWKLMKMSIVVRFIKNPQVSHVATYGGRTLTFNVGRLGFKWFDRGISNDVLDLIIHEFGHEYESNHLSASYNNALTKLAAKAIRLALDEPSFFSPSAG